MSFAGKFERKGLAKGAAIRRKLKEQCDHVGEDCVALDCFMECECSELLALQLRSQFCLQPPGDTDTRRSTFDSLQASSDVRLSWVVRFGKVRFRMCQRTAGMYFINKAIGTFVELLNSPWGIKALEGAPSFACR